MSNVPAGWYSDPEDPKQVRYWDGVQWTSSTAPAMSATSEQAAVVASSPATVTTPLYPMSPQDLPRRHLSDPNIGSASTGAGSSKKKWLIGGAIAAGVIVVGSVGAALGSGGPTDTVPETSTAPVVSTPSPTPTEVVAAPTPTATPVEVVNAIAFRAQAGSHLDDMLKDLDDIVTTVDEDGFWRLLSNTGELAFNQGQLESLDVPANLVTAWPESLVALQGTLDSLTDAIGTQDGPSILAAVGTVRTQVEATRAVVNTAQ